MTMNMITTRPGNVGPKTDQAITITFWRICYVTPPRGSLYREIPQTKTLGTLRTQLPTISEDLIVWVTKQNLAKDSTAPSPKSRHILSLGSINWQLRTLAIQKLVMAGKDFVPVLAKSLQYAEPSIRIISVKYWDIWPRMRPASHC